MKYLCTLFLILIFPLIHAAEHYFERDKFIFTNGSGFKANILSSGSSSAQALTKTMTVDGRDLDDILGVGSFCGAIQAFAYVLNPIPAGWLLCDGTTYVIADHPELALLFFKIGNTYGGNGTTTFKVPNLLGRFIRAKNPATSFGTYYPDQIQGHLHSTVDLGHTHQVTNSPHNHGTNLPSDTLRNSGSTLASAGASSGFEYFTTFVDITLGTSVANMTVPATASGVNGLGDPIDYSPYGTVRYDTETRPKNNNIVYYIRY